jgi:lipid-A-disaccharide synthase
MINSAPRIVIVAGEASGDLLGGELIHALRQYFPTARFEGIAGPNMIAAGCEALFPIDALSFMLLEVFKQLPRILSIRRQLLRSIKNDPPLLYIGIDAPDFNLPVELKVHKQGIKTVHYVSPSVWAWRRGRLKTIAKATDLMLTLFPFEAAFYEEHNLSALFVGHPLADQIPLVNDKASARQQLQLPTDKLMVALLPGSRHGEIERIGPLFLQAAKLCLAAIPTVQFITPMVNAEREAQFRAQLQVIAPELPITIVQGQSSLVMAAADSILVASGTATLEAMLHKKPMVVGYIMSKLTFALGRMLVDIKYLSLPNLLHDKALVSEFVQHNATPENFANAIVEQLQHPEKFTMLLEQFTQTHQQLKQNASEQAAKAIKALLD